MRKPRSPCFAQKAIDWSAFCTITLNQSALATDARFETNQLRSQNRGALQQIIEAAFATLTASQVVAALDAAKIANARINTMTDVWAHPQLQARGRWTEVASPVGPMPALQPPGLDDARIDAIPAVGEHTRPILTELGYTAEQITEWATNGTISY